jgi:hypothetical protein
MGAGVIELGRSGTVVMVNFIVGDVGPSEVVGEDGACPHARGVEFGGAGEDFSEEVGRGDESVFVGDVGVLGACPVAVPWCFGIAVAAWADLGGWVVGVKS